MVKISWLKEAKQDLKEIYDYISPDSKRYARHQIDRIFNKTQVIKNHIKVGRIVEELSQPEIREIIEGNYRIIYKIKDEKSVDILMVHHAARNLSRRVKKK